MRWGFRFQRQKGKAILLLRGLPGQNARMAQADYAQAQGARAGIEIYVIYLPQNRLESMMKATMQVNPIIAGTP
jgi:hypothetical protein